jgi:hypothetical protein
LEEHPDYVNVFYKYFVEMLSEWTLQP